MSADNSFAHGVLSRDSAARWQTAQSDALKPKKQNSSKPTPKKVAELTLLDPFSVVLNVKYLEQSF